MLHVSTPPFRRQRGRPKGKPPATPAPPPTALVLLAATYNPDQPAVDLQFDRAVGIAGFNGSAVVVDDGETLAMKLNGEGGATLVNPQTVRVALTTLTDSETSQVLLTASAFTGIVAVNNGGTWSGVSNLVLPFP